MNYYKLTLPHKVKMKALKIIHDDRCEGIYDGNDQISESSYLHKGCFNNRVNMKLMDLYYEHIHEALNKGIYENAGVYVDLDNIWYQVYKANSRDTHDFHIHEDVDFSHIYYVQLKDVNISTQFIENNVIVGCSDIEEGDVVTFHPSIIHRSPPNTTKFDKIVIAFNTNIQDM